MKLQNKQLQFFTITNHAVMNILILCFSLSTHSPIQLSQEFGYRQFVLENIPGTTNEKIGKGKQERENGQQSMFYQAEYHSEQLGCKTSSDCMKHASGLLCQSTRRLEHLATASPSPMLRVVLSNNTGTSCWLLHPLLVLHLFPMKGLNQLKGLNEPYNPGNEVRVSMVADQ